MTAAFDTLAAARELETAGQGESDLRAEINAAGALFATIKLVP